MKVLFYGKLASAAGAELDVPIEGATSVAGLRRRLSMANPGLAEMLCDRRVRALVGEAFVGDDHMLAPDDEIEFLAPVSGG